MDLRKAQELAQNLMWEYGVTQRGWSFEWDKRPRRRLGRTSYSRRVISLSVIPTREGTEVEVEDTIRHEIAHVLVGPGHGHDEAWRAMAREVGARPRAASEMSETGWETKYDRGPKYRGRCSCGLIHGLRRMTARRRDYVSVCNTCHGPVEWIQQY